jgi:hypothetical protein
MATQASHDGWTSKKVLYNVVFVFNAHHLEDRFETLCHVSADISAAPFTTKLGISGKMCYTRKFYLVLLVGLTELKAQIRWIDSATVRVNK